MKSKPAAFLLASCSLLALSGCGPALEDPPPTRAERSGAASSDAAQAARREAFPPAAVARGAPDSTATMGAAGAARVTSVPPSALPPALKVDDAQLSARVRSELAAARDLGEARIDVDSRDGVVTLSGPVRSMAGKARASEIARMVRGVVEVNDQLTLVNS